MSSPGSSDPESAGRSPGRTKNKPGYSSYAAIGLLKDNPHLLPSKAKPGADASKAPSERSTQDDMPSTSKLQTLKAEHAGTTQRAPPSRENAMLRAELEVLRQQNQELTGKLRVAEGRLGQHSRELKHQHSGLQQELISLREALQSADAEKANALSVAESAFLQMEGVRQALEGLLLQPQEVEAAALHCCWLAHYWELALRFGLVSEVAASQAAHWRAMAPPATAMLESAQHLQKRRKVANREQVAPANGATNAPPSSSSSSNSTDDPGPAWLQSASGRFSSCMQASAGDVLEIDLGLRQLQELGVEAAVMAALAEQARVQRLTVQLPPAVPDGTQPPYLPVTLGQDEAEEVRFQAAHLAYLWGRAAALGIETQLAAERAEYWCWRLDRRATLRDFQDLRHGFQELRALGVEQQLWQKRHRQLPMQPQLAKPLTALQQPHSKQKVPL